MTACGQRQVRVNERIDRLPVWGLSPVVYVVLGFCYLLAFYDIAVIGVALPRIVEDLQLSASEEALPLRTAFGARSVFRLLVGVVVVAFLIMCTSLRTSQRSFAEQSQ